MSSRIALYVRVPSDHQAHEGTIDSQGASLRAYGAEHQARCCASRPGMPIPLRHG